MNEREMTMENGKMIEDNDILIWIGNNNTIRVKTVQQDGNEMKQITADELITLLNVSKTNVNSGKMGEVDYQTELLPGFNHVKTVQYKKYKNGKEVYVLYRNAGRFDFMYENKKFEQVGVPNLLFAVIVANGIVQGLKICAVKDKVVRPETRIHYYPFTHVSSPKAKACTGGNRLSNLKLTNAYQIHSLPDMFLSMPNGNDYGSHNSMGLEMRPLLEMVKRKDFNEDYLMDAEMTYQEWYAQL